MAQQDRAQRRARVTRYIAERLKAETPERGDTAAIAKAIGFSDAHLSNIKTSKTRGVGDDLLRALAAYWKMSQEELEREALAKVPAEAVADEQPNRAIVMESAEYQEASDAAKEAFATWADRHAQGKDLSVVAWAVALDKILKADAEGILESRGGTPIKSTR